MDPVDNWGTVLVWAGEVAEKISHFKKRVNVVFESLVRNTLNKIDDFFLNDTELSKLPH